MSRPTEPIDLLSNYIVKDCLVGVHFATIPIFKVIAVENGGIHTANGVTPTTVRIICDLTLKQPPGVPFSALIRVVSPSEQEFMQRILDSATKRS
jgi:hypothetical protein